MYDAPVQHALLTYRFTGKERDAESGLDNFGARYNSSSMGRFMSPDPTMLSKQRLRDPQQWNMYAYVRNNPLAHIDPDGKACSALNNGSAYCQRADLYANFDSLVHDKTRFFAAASAASQALANVAVPGLGRVGTSSGTRAFLESTGEALQALNTQTVGKIISGQITGSGADLDAKIVHLEQTAVQGQLDSLKQSDPAGYSDAVKEINSLLNSNGGIAASALAGLSGAIFPTDKAYADVLADVRNGLGHDIDFGNQQDREAIGNALANHIRQGNGCDVAGDRAHGCPQ
jgi:RHS repeat-associated protein